MAELSEFFGAWGRKMNAPVATAIAEGIYLPSTPQTLWTVRRALIITMAQGEPAAHMPLRRAMVNLSVALPQAGWMELEARRDFRQYLGDRVNAFDAHSLDTSLHYCFMEQFRNVQIQEELLQVNNPTAREIITQVTEGVPFDKLLFLSSRLLGQQPYHAWLGQQRKLSPTVDLMRTMAENLSPMEA